MATCTICDALASDPRKGPSPWAVAVISNEQVLVCPDCQIRHPGWIDEADPCPACGSKRLRKMLGDRVCRACGHRWGDEPFEL